MNKLSKTGIFLVIIAVFVVLKLMNEISFAGRSMKVSTSINQLERHVREMTTVSPPRNYANLESLNSIARYIANNFKKSCSDVYEQKFMVEGNEYKNVVCSLNRDKRERIVIGAHYDVAGNQPGADDNASAVAGLLELARMLKEEVENIPYRIDLVAYSLEEPPFFRTKHMGSYHHAKSLTEENAIVKIMICLEMIGYFSEEDDSQSYPLPFFSFFYPDVGNYIMVVGNLGGVDETKKIRDLMKASGADVDIHSVNLPFWIPGVDLSDHYNYWKFDYPAVMITDTAFYRNDNYHLPSDTMKTLNFQKMSAVVDAVCYSVLNFHSD